MTTRIEEIVPQPPGTKLTRARKIHICTQCKKPIKKGDYYLNYIQSTDSRKWFGQSFCNSNCFFLHTTAISCYVDINLARAVYYLETEVGNIPLLVHVNVENEKVLLSFDITSPMGFDLNGERLLAHDHYDRFPLREGQNIIKAHKGKYSIVITI